MYSKAAMPGVAAGPARRGLLPTLAIAVVPAVLLLAAAGPAHALELGFEAYAAVTASDNVGAVNAPDEEGGQIGTGLIGIYGEQRGRRASAGFEGEIDGRRRLDGEDQQGVDTVTRFLGAAEFAITPRALSWYVGDILGGVRLDNAIQPINDDADSIRQRNIFVTGPELDFAIDSDTRLSSRLLYVNQSEEGESLETLWNANVDWQRETTPGSYFGVSVNDIYTDNTDVDASDIPSPVPGQDAPIATGDREGAGDFNRLSVSTYWNRVRGFSEIYAQIGATRYDTELESLNGVNGALRMTRTLSRESTVSVGLTRDLSDQTLSTVESLVEDGRGVQPEAEGFFDETRLEALYALKSTRASVDLGAGLAKLDYRLIAVEGVTGVEGVSEDQTQAYVFGSLTRPITTRLRTELGARYERQTYDDREDESDSILATGRVLYRIARSFELEASYAFDRAEGVTTRLQSDGSGANQLLREPVDVTENRVSFGIRWAPPSRANRDLTIELKSLLQ